MRDRVGEIQLVDHLVVGRVPDPAGPGDVTGVGAFVALEDPEEGGLARTVRSVDDDAVPAADLEVEPVEQRVVAVGLREPLDPAERVLDVQAAVDVGDDVVDRTRGLRLLDLRQLRGEILLPLRPWPPRDGPRCPRPRRRAARTRGRTALEALQPELLLHDVLVEVAGVLVQVEVLDLDDARDHGVEEGPVVRDDDRRAAEGAEPGFEPLDARDVEEVRGLVEKQDVGRLEEDLRERRAVAPAAGERIDRGAHGARRRSRGW